MPLVVTVGRAFRACGSSLAGLAALVILAVGFAHAPAAFAADSSAATPDVSAPLTVSVVIQGSLPGFTGDQLSAYVSQQMMAAHIASWRFEPAAGSGDAPMNRVVWNFKLLPYAGGSVRYIGPATAKLRDLFGVGRAIGIDAKMYLGGQYQSTTFDQATIKGGPHDPDLSDVIRKLTKSIIANALAEQPKNEGVAFG